MHKEIGREAKVAARILSEVKAAERSLRWLARSTGIPYSTLYNKVKNSPGSLTIDDLLSVSDALAIELPALMGVAA